MASATAGFKSLRTHVQAAKDGVSPDCQHDDEDEVQRGSGGSVYWNSPVLCSGVTRRRLRIARMQVNKLQGITVAVLQRVSLTDHCCRGHAATQPGAALARGAAPQRATGLALPTISSGSDHMLNCVFCRWCSSRNSERCR